MFDIDPKDYCGFNPCEEVKCFATLLARCITDFDCNPLFFDQHGNTIKTCQGEHYKINKWALKKIINNVQAATNPNKH